MSLLPLFVTPASAIGLGTATLDSGLGEPLRFSVPVTLGPGEEVGCVQIRPRGDDLPAAVRARTSVVHSGDQTRVEVSTAAAVSEPAIGVVVSVGCTSPVAREFVFFLDPPREPALPTVVATVRSTVEPNIPRETGTPRAARASRGASASTTGAADSSPRRPRRARPPAADRALPPATASGAAVPDTQTPALAPNVGSSPPPRSGDRLSVTPTEPSAAAGSPQGRGTAGRDGRAATDAAPDTSATGSGVEPDAPAREQVLRERQAALDEQVRTLTEQIAALRAQTSALAARNQVLIDRTEESGWLRWLPLVLAAIATVLAIWMAWRYARLRRSLEGSPWWSGNTVQAPTATPLAESRFEDGDLSALDPGTRLVPRAPSGVDARASAATSAVTATAPIAELRSRPSPRPPQRYSAAIETDFTVSDIEAAMATVRTVPTSSKGVQRLGESDLGPLGGPTLPSPFADPPPSASMSAASRTAATDRAGTPGAAATPPAPPVAPAQGEESMDFNLDLPTTFDPLATDSHTRTAVDPPGGAVDFDIPPRAARSPTLDFELPSAASTQSMPVRHGATALDDVFASDTGRLGADTILALDDGDGAPLSPTDVERLAPVTAEPLPAHSRMARFADLMNEVDETALVDPLRAIALLRQYVLRDETIPTLLWLRLFTLYRTVDKKPVYEALAEHFARRYLRPMVGWSETLADRVPQTPLSSFHDLDADIERSWGTAAGLERLQALLCGRDQEDAVVFNEVLQRDLLDTAKIYLLERDSSIVASKT